MAYLGRSGQLWKFYVFTCIFVIAGSVLLFQASLYKILGKEITMVVVLAATGVSLVSSILACLAIRCPGCKHHLLWHAVSKQYHNSWFQWLITLDACPACGRQ